MSDKPVTREIIEAYVNTLEKQVQQATLIIKALEELNENLKEINPHITTKNEIVIEKIEKALTTIYIIKDYVSRAEESDKDLNNRAYELTNEIKDKISSLKNEMQELKTSIKVERYVSIVGWSTFIVTMITMILRLFGKV